VSPEKRIVALVMSKLATIYMCMYVLGSLEKLARKPAAYQCVVKEH